MVGKSDAQSVQQQNLILKVMHDIKNNISVRYSRVRGVQIKCGKKAQSTNLAIDSAKYWRRRSSV